MNSCIILYVHYVEFLQQRCQILRIFIQVELMVILQTLEALLHICTCPIMQQHYNLQITQISTMAYAILQTALIYFLIQLNQPSLISRMNKQTNLPQLSYLQYNYEQPYLTFLCQEYASFCINKDQLWIKFSFSLMISITSLFCYQSLNIYSFFEQKMKSENNKIKVREISMLRKTKSKISRLNQVGLEQSANYSQIIKSQIVQSAYLPETNGIEPTSKPQFINELSINKIYNRDINGGIHGDFNKAFRSKRLSCSYMNVNMHKMANNEINTKNRPMSNHLASTKPIKIFKKNNDVLNCQNRPGSSKSSRFFKSKYEESQNNQNEITTKTINTENDDFDLLIRINSRQDNKANKSHQHNRICDSSKKGQQYMINSKLDPAFFKLFAK